MKELLSCIDNECMSFFFRLSHILHFHLEDIEGFDFSSRARSIISLVHSIVVDHIELKQWW
jgi:hypothetical protein